MSPKKLQNKGTRQVAMKQYFKNNKMWCESQNLNVQAACRVFVSEEMITIIGFKRNPIKRTFNYIRKKVNERPAISSRQP